MHNYESILSTTPNPSQLDTKVLAACLDACAGCELSCVSCADACLNEKNVDMLRRCIRLDLDCADVCGTTARLLARLTSADATLLRGQLEICAQACAACAVECERHAQHHEHCRICAEACRACEEACEQLLQALPSAA